MTKLGTKEMLIKDRMNEKRSVTILGHVHSDYLFLFLDLSPHAWLRTSASPRTCYILILTRNLGPLVHILVPRPSLFVIPLHPHSYPRTLPDLVTDLSRLRVSQSSDTDYRV